MSATVINRNDQKDVPALARLIDTRLQELKGVKTQKDVAREVGFKNSNIVTMIKLGDTKLSIDRVRLMARALEVDEKHLMRLALEQFYTPKTTEIIMNFFKQPLSDNEMEIIEAIREVTGDTDPKLTAAQRDKLQDIFR